MNPVARIKRYFRYGFWTTVKLDWRVFRLRWRDFWGQRLAPYLWRELPLLRKQIIQLTNDLVNAEQNMGRCNHLTIRAPFLPCPHPDCYSVGGTLYLNHYHYPGHWIPRLFLTPEEPMTQQSSWKREKVTIGYNAYPRTEVWAWIPLCGFPPKENPDAI